MIAKKIDLTNEISNNDIDFLFNLIDDKSISDEQLRRIEESLDDEEVWAKLSRQNTGSHFMDSGGRSGRHWQKDLPKELELETYSSDGKVEEIGAYIPLHLHLNAGLGKIDLVATRQLRELNEDVEELAECLGLELIGSDNSYNRENDLSQDYQSHIISSDSEWLYADVGYMVIETHNGADIRGGYSSMLVARIEQDNTILFDPQVEWVATSGVDAEGNEIEDLYEECSEFSIGYTSNPTYEFNENIKEIVSVDEEAMEVEVVMNNGSKLVVYPSFRDCY